MARRNRKRKCVEATRVKPKLDIKKDKKSPVAKKNSLHPRSPDIYQSQEQEESAVVSAIKSPPHKDIFDELLEPSQQPHFDKNKIRTYENRRRIQQLEEQHEDKILEFEDCRNREHILQWLNDNRNRFDHFTQQSQQEQFQTEFDDIPLSMDMPSMSQIRVPEKRVTRSQTTDNRRARSLEVTVIKNVKRGRVKRHSLAGDSQTVENYNIEDEEQPLEKETKMLLNLEEDEYLSTLDKELSTKKEQTGWDRMKKLEKTIKKTMRKPKKLNITIETNNKRRSPRNLNRDINTHSKQPKSAAAIIAVPENVVEVVAEVIEPEIETHYKEEISNEASNFELNLTVDLSVIEKFIDKNIEIPENRSSENINCCSFHKNPTSSIFKHLDNLSTIQTILAKGEDFFNNLNNVKNIEEQNKLFPLYLKLKQYFDNFWKVEKTVQTNLILFEDAIIQTDENENNTSLHIINVPNNIVTKSVEVRETQTDLQVMEKEVQTHTQLNRDQETQTKLKGYIDEEIQTDPQQEVDVFENTEKLNLLAPHSNKIPQTDDFNDSLNFDFETEDLVRRASTKSGSFSNHSSQKSEKNECDIPSDTLNVMPFTNNSSKVPKTVQNITSPKSQINVSYSHNSPQLREINERIERSVTPNIVSISNTTKKCNENPQSPSPIIITIPSDSSQSSQISQGVKRCRSPSVENSNKNHLKKRPCEKFIPENLSVNFAFSQENEAVADDLENSIQLSNISEEMKCNKYVDKLLTSNSTSSSPSKMALRTKTQELIEECDMLIYNATKPKIKINIENKENFYDSKNKSQINLPNSDSDDCFNEVVMNEENLHKIEEDINKFESKNHTEQIFEDSKSSRKCLFNTSKEENERLSESLFINHNDTVIPSQVNVDNNITLTQNMFPRSFSEVYCTPPRKYNDNIKVLQNILLKEGNSDNSNVINENEDDEVIDHDIIDTTPQKKVKSFSLERSMDVLNITLPPPLEFQDDNDAFAENSVVDIAKLNITTTPSHNPLQISIRKKNIRHSTPNSQKPSTSSILSLSPISLEMVNNTLPVPSLKNSPSTFKCTQDSVQRKTFISQEIRPSQSKPCIACSRISKEQVIAISSLTNKKLASYSASFSPKVSHLIVSVDEKNCTKDHTIKYVSAVASGIWILNFKWIQDCLNRNAILPEEPYEVLDVSGLDGPRQARLNRLSNPLFKGYLMCAAPPFISTTQGDLENVIHMLGGETVPTPENLVDKQKLGKICIIVTEARATQDFDLYEHWLDALKIITVDIEWLSRSIGQYKVLSLRPYVLCSDDTLSELGYPSELLAQPLLPYSDFDINMS